MVRLVSRHLGDRALFAVLESGDHAILLIRYSSNRAFRREVEEAVSSGLIGLGLVAFRTEEWPRVERCYRFPWHQGNHLDDRVCRLIEEAMEALPTGILDSGSRIRIPLRAIV